MHERARLLNRKPRGGGAVVYWMNRDMRAADNWALLLAAEEASRAGVGLAVIFCLKVNYLGGGLRQWDFKVRGLQETAERLAAHHIPFYIFPDEEAALAQLKKWDLGLVVTDFSPLRQDTTWTEAAARALPAQFMQVDAHNVVPAWIASPKLEFAARTIRPKIQALLPKFLCDFPKLGKAHHPWPYPVPEISWEKLLHSPHVDKAVPVQTWAQPGTKAGMRLLREFLNERLPGYAEGRNDPNTHAQSGLSPYFHYGFVAPQRAAWEASHLPGSEVFLEELIIRRELADNFCLYQSAYDSTRGFPAWAQKTLLEHVKDKREYLYSQEQFEQAATHDALWNAAQTEMLRTGKMHGYMRMYWAKKILEWTRNPDEAIRIAVYLNDRYELDGRDPNGYTGIAWSIGGVHDRAWFPRPIFGTVRYMNANGAATKFDTAAYIARWS